MPSLTGTRLIHLLADRPFEVVIHEYEFNGGWQTFRGSVNAGGEVSTTFAHTQKSPYPIVDTLSGTIHDKKFRGQYLHGNRCYWDVQMGPAPAPTMPYDGEYGGVSREVLDGGGNEPRCYPRALTPPRPLYIDNGIVGTPGRVWWQGTVSRQGAMVLRNPNFMRVDAQIDPQGTIRGQYSGKMPDEVLAQIGGGTTNCMVRFVWQRE